MIPEVFADPSIAQALARDGFAKLAPMGDDRVAAFCEIAERTRPRVKTDYCWEKRGYDELMYLSDLDVRRAAQAQLEEVVEPYAAMQIPGAEIVVSNLLVKAPRSAASVVPFHQDATIVDETAGPLSLQMWIPFVDVDAVEDGGLAFVPRSHLVDNPFRAIGDGTPFDRHIDAVRGRAVRPKLRAGEPMIFTGRTLHGSPPNLRQHPRYALALMLVPKGTELVHVVRSGKHDVDLVAMDAEELRRLSPGTMPKGRVLRSVHHEDTSLDDAAFGAWATL